MHADVRRVLDRLEERAQREAPRLDELRKKGGTSIRDVAGELMLSVSPETGKFLNTLVRAMHAVSIVELGTSVGYSTIWLCEAAAHTGGRVLTFEPAPEKLEQAHDNLANAGLRDVAELVGEAAQERLGSLEGPIDLVFLDHWKELYRPDFRTLWPILRSGGVVVADNILVPTKNAAVIAEYLECVRTTPGARTMTLSIGEGLELTVKE